LFNKDGRGVRRGLPKIIKISAENNHYGFNRIIAFWSQCFKLGAILEHSISAALFSPLINTTFAFVIPDFISSDTGKESRREDDNRPTLKEEKIVDLTLVEVSKERNSGPFLSFHLIFHGPDLFLPQGCYLARHEKLEDIEFFIVPVGDIKNDDGRVTGYEYQVCYSVKTVADGT
jgi:hypothetical protein